VDIESENKPTKPETELNPPQTESTCAAASDQMVACPTLVISEEPSRACIGMGSLCVLVGADTGVMSAPTKTQSDPIPMQALEGSSEITNVGHATKSTEAQADHWLQHRWIRSEAG
jgi:hypothetical protein